MVVGFVATAALCGAADVSVHLLSAKDGQPISERHIHLTIIDPEIKHVPEDEIFSGWKYTDDAGIASFHVSVSVPEDALVDVFGLVDYCSHRQYRASEVFQTGVADRFIAGCPHRPLKKLNVRARPGEIVMFSGEYSRWERMLYFPWPS